MADQYFFRGGIHPPEMKETTHGKSIETAPLLGAYTVPLQQHIGAPAKLLVSKKDTVKRGQMLAEPGGFVSAAIHSPTSGTVKSIGTCIGPTGSELNAVEIESDGEDTAAEALPPIPEWQNTEPQELIQRICDAGIVGMGGAAFPTNVKLSPPPSKSVDTLIINGAECEPCLTADHRLMLERTEQIVAGIQIVARALGVKTIFAAVEANKPDAYEALREQCRDTAIQVKQLRVRYPQGAEKQLIYALTQRKVPTGGLPMDVGAVVQNVSTVNAVAEAVLLGKPLYERIVTVTGTPVTSPGNWLVRVGTPVKEVLTFAGGIQKETRKLILGGPMMGQSLNRLDVPLQKGSSGVVCLGADEVHQFTSEACIRCGRCTERCPMALMPGTLSVQIENENFEAAESWYVMDCIECGCCAYACPANRPLVQHMKRAKGEITARRKAARETKAE